MAEEKKKTTRSTASTAKKVTKKVTKKATTKAKSTTKKVASTAKSTTKKATTKAKSTAKKATSTAKKPVKVAKSVIRPGKVVTMTDWKKTATGAFGAWKSVGWRIFVLFLSFFAAMMPILALIGGGYTLLAGGFQGLENQFVNLQFGNPDLAFLWGAGLGFILLLTAIFVLSFLVNIATWLTLKNYAHGKPNNPLIVFFRDSWAYLGRYTWLSVKIFLYLLVPILGLVLFGALMSTLFGAAANFIGDPTMSMALMVALGILSVIVLFFLLRMLFRRWTEAIMMPIVLMESDDSVTNVWSKSLSLAQKNWGAILGAILLFAFPFWIVQVISDPELMQLYAPEAFLNNDWLFGGAIAFNVLFSLLIMTPITTAFLYGITRHLGNVKNIKL